jgi:hypothetical protein
MKSGNLKLHNETAKSKKGLIVASQFLFFMLLLNGCVDTKQLTDSICAVDVTKIHPEKFYNGEKELVSVEYIPMETNNEFLCAGGYVDGKVVAFTDEVIIYRNFNVGDILIFDRKGKALKKINRRGQGPEEYSDNLNVIYDDANKELFVNSVSSGKILVYDLEGNFKRSFPNNHRGIFNEMENYDEKSLICYIREDIESPLFLISKRTGEKLRDIIIPYEKRLFTDFRRREGDKIISGQQISGKRLIKVGKEFVIFEPSSDTIYSLNTKESVLRPLMYRTPPIQKMNIPVILQPSGKIGNFLFITRLKKADDLKNNQRYSTDNFVYNFQNNKFYEILHFPNIFSGNGVNAVHDNRSNVCLVEFPAYEAIKWKDGKEPFEKKLAVANLKEDDNPVLVIVTLKE